MDDVDQLVAVTVLLVAPLEHLGGGLGGVVRGPVHPVLLACGVEKRRERRSCGGGGVSEVRKRRKG